jgi:group II intron reverse transcriptase/maturase
MPVEQRDWHIMNLFTGTSAALRDSIKRHYGKGQQMSLWPNRWERIGSRALEKDVKFNNLLTHINVETLREAFHALDGTKAVGIDGINKAQYGVELESNLKELADRIHNGSYKPQDKREVLIPKSDGKKRPLAIACFEDKLVDWVISKLLSAIFEPIFIRNSFGFRPNKSAHEALKASYMSLKGNKRPYVVEIDFASFFNTIPHKGIMKALEKRITDDRFKGLIGRFLKGGILEQSGETTSPTVGTPQGGIMSPILANIYLDEAIDQWFVENYASYSNVIVRYADDAVFIFKEKAAADAFLVELQKRVARFGLTLNADKTRTVDFRKSENNDFDFLGFTFYWGEKKKFRPRPLKIKTRKKSLHKKMQEFDEWIKENRSAMKLAVLWEKAKEKLEGHYAYFGLWTNYPKLRHFYSEAIKSLFKWLNRRSQKRSYTWEQFTRRLERLPLPKPPELARLRSFERSIYV